MRYLFVHQNFPGQYLHILRALAATGAHDLLFLTDRNENVMPGVRKVEYPLLRASTPGVHHDAVEFEAATIRAASVAAMARQLAGLGYRPDVMVGHNGWGELLNLKDVWPDAPLVPYFEFYYADRGLDVDFDPEFPVAAALRPGIRARNAVNLLGLGLADAGQTPTCFQHGTYPGWARDRITVVPEGVDLDRCRPVPDAAFALPAERRAWTRTGRPLVTFVARNLEPYRGFHVMMRALPRLLAARPEVDVVLVGGDAVSYGAPPPSGTWRERLLTELGGRLPPGRVFLPGKIPYEDYLALLQVSAVHVYLTYPFVASWSLREALACGCAVLGSDTAPVREFITHDENGRLTPFHDPRALADSILALLEDAPARARLGAAARRRAEATLDLDTHLAAFGRLVAGVTGRALPSLDPVQFSS